jgi:hypothetical protein
VIDLTTYPNPLMNKPVKQDTGFKASSHELFMLENFKIVNKEQQSVPFSMQPAQHSLNTMMQHYFDILVLKARKMGFSSDALGIATTKFLMGENEKCVSMSFEQSASEKQLARAKYYIKAYEEINNMKVNFKYNSKNTMALESKKANDKGGYDYFQNILQVGTFGNTSFGRGDDITFLHLTEVSLADLLQLMAGVGEACLPTAHKILETTANGFNSYKSTWDEAILGNNNFAALFYSPYWEYAEEYVTKKRKDLGRLGPQEFPLTAEEAFLTSGELYLDQVALRWYMENTREVMAV